jgi:hypothetical protein
VKTLKLSDPAFLANVSGGYIQATGGTVTTAGGFRTHRFTANGTFQVTDAGSTGAIDYLIAGGGAGGGRGTGAGGGGGGGRLIIGNTTVIVDSYTITIGGGGTGATTNTHEINKILLSHRGLGKNI